MSHEYPYSIKRHGTTLEKCEDEPVQMPGCIQSHGVLLVLRRSDLTILQVSENCLEWLGLSPTDLLAKSVAKAVGESVAQKIRIALDHEGLDRASLYLTTLQPRKRRNSRALHVSLHTHADLALLELEEAAASDLEPPDRIRVDPDYYGLVRRTLTRFQEASSIRMLAQAITEEMRRITELDRVMIYYFHDDDSGEVIAESKREDKNSWLGWRYPAHDIPRPAREIFKKIWSRPVPDVRAELFEMIPLLNPDTQQALDMTYCSLRGASVMYTEYLDNMGVRAALTLPLMREGELWGLIACHHDTPKIMSYRIRAAAEFLARGASQQFGLVEERENTAYRVSLEAANYELISKVALAPELSAFTKGSVHLGASLDCGGAAIFFQESWNKVGQTPQIHEMADLGQWLLTQPACQEGSPNPVFVTDHLSDIYPAAKDFTGIASGLMAFCFSRDPLGLVLYFKPETLQTLTWAGNPNELPVIEGPHGPRLSPRKSFELWRETVSNRSMPWKRVEIDAVLKLRGLIIDMLVSKSEQLHALRLHVAERTQELAVSQAHLQSVLDAATEIGIVACDPQGLITVFNSGAERMLGYAAEEMVGKQTPAIFHLESEIVQRGRELTEELGKPLQGRDVLIAKALNGQPEEREWTYVRKDGSHVPVLLIVTSVCDESGKLLGFVGVSRDITARKQYESQLLEAKERAEQADQAKSDFLATMSHEIRTPMNGVIGMTGLLLDTALDAKQRNLAETIRISGESLLHLINDILDFSKIEAGQMALESLDFDLRELVEGTVEMMAIQAHAKGIALVSSVAREMPARLRGDPGRVRQVLTNLIGNAIKFTKEGEVAVDVTLEEEETNVLVRFEIKDTGMGVPIETQARLFQPFVQADSSTSRKFGGTGLGLAICKQLAESMNGGIGMESIPGHGSTFWVTMRFSRQAGVSVEPPPTLSHGGVAGLPHPANSRDSSQPEPLRKERVLLAEDNLVNQQVALGNLRKLGYDADVAANGFEVLEATASKSYDIILMDCQMPELDGYQATKEIRQRERKGQHAYIIAMTANAMVGDRERCLAAGMDDYVSKPLSREELRAALLRGAAETVTPLNGDALCNLMTHDDQEVAQWIELFAATAPGSIADMKRAHEESRAGDLSMAAHSLKGSCVNFGASALAELCAQIEKAANRGNLHGMGDLIASAEKELGRVIEALEQFKKRCRR